MAQQLHELPSHDTATTHEILELRPLMTAALSYALTNSKRRLYKQTSTQRLHLQRQLPEQRDQGREYTIQPTDPTDE